MLYFVESFRSMNWLLYIIPNLWWYTACSITFLVWILLGADLERSFLVQVQAQVRKTKQRFDKLKLDVMQKVDLLAASRCNMFSHVLANYQSTLLHFWEKTSRTMAAVAESFKGYQYYEFNMLKVIADCLRKSNKYLSPHLLILFLSCVYNYGKNLYIESRKKEVFCQCNSICSCCRNCQTQAGS